MTAALPIAGPHGIPRSDAIDGLGSQFMTVPVTAPTIWHPNFGHPPVFVPEYDDQPCPPNLIHIDEAQNARVRVKLRNDMEPAESWPVFGRPLKTRWTLTRCDFDIKLWRPA